MKIDPNDSISQKTECIFCAGGEVHLHDGSRCPVSELTNPEGAFHKFCSGLDPNLAFIIAYVPDDEDREVFFAAREAAAALQIQMGAPIEKKESLRKRWDAYCASTREAPKEIEVEMEPESIELNDWEASRE